MNNSLNIAIAVVAVHKRRQIATRHDVADTGCDLTKPHQPDIGDAIASANERKTSNEISLKPGSLSEPRADRIVRSWKYQRLLACNKLSKRGHGASLLIREDLQVDHRSDR